jgi:hypothetical protein
MLNFQNFGYQLENILIAAGESTVLSSSVHTDTEGSDGTP